MSTMNEPEKCPECCGLGVEFRGRGLDAQYRVCSRWREAGHPSEEDIRAKIRDGMVNNYPTSGRFA